MKEEREERDGKREIESEREREREREEKEKGKILEEDSLDHRSPQREKKIKVWFLTMMENRLKG